MSGKSLIHFLSLSQAKDLLFNMANKKCVIISVNDRPDIFLLYSSLFYPICPKSFYICSPWENEALYISFSWASCWLLGYIAYKYKKIRSFPIPPACKPFSKACSKPETWKTKMKTWFSLLPHDSEKQAFVRMESGYIIPIITFFLPTFEITPLTIPIKRYPGQPSAFTEFRPFNLQYSENR